MGRPALPGLLVAAGVVVLCAVGYLLFTPLTGRTLGTPPGWLGLLLGVFLFNGVAEEVAWRGYVFGALRQGLSRAGTPARPAPGGCRRTPGAGRAW